MERIGALGVSAWQCGPTQKKHSGFSLQAMIHGLDRMFDSRPGRFVWDRCMIGKRRTHGELDQRGITTTRLGLHRGPDQRILNPLIEPFPPMKPRSPCRTSYPFHQGQQALLIVPAASATMTTQSQSSELDFGRPSGGCRRLSP